MALYKKKYKNIQEYVYFPPFFNLQKHSNLLLSFFQLNNIDCDDKYFNLQILRNLYNKDYRQFELIKNELIIKGFNFMTQKQTSFFPKSLSYDSEPILLNLKKGRLTPIDLNKFGLFRKFSQLGWYDRDYLNFIPISRLELFNNKTDIFSEKQNFKIFNNFQEAKKYKSKTNNFSLDNDEIQNSSSQKDTIYHQEEKAEILINDIGLKEKTIDYVHNKACFDDTMKDISKLTKAQMNNYLKFKKICEEEIDNVFVSSVYSSDDELEFNYDGIPIIWLYLLVETARKAPKIYKILLDNKVLSLKTFFKFDQKSIEDKVFKNVYASSYDYTYFLNVFLDILKQFILKRDEMLREIDESLNKIGISTISSIDILIFPNTHISKQMFRNTNNVTKRNFIELLSKYLMFNYSNTQISNMNYRLSENDIKNKQLTSFDNIGVARSIVQLLEMTNVVILNDLINITNADSKFYQSIIQNSVFQEIEWIWIFKLIDAEIKMKPYNINHEIETYLKKEDNIWHAILQENVTSQLKENKYTRIADIEIVKDREKKDSINKMSLELIGKKYNLTRERVRQRQKRFISNNSKIFEMLLNIFMENKKLMHIEKITQYVGVESYLMYGESKFMILKRLNSIVKVSNARSIEPLLNKFLNASVIDTHDLNKFKQFHGFSYEYFIYNSTKYSLVANRYINSEKISHRDLASYILLELGEDGFNENTKDFAKEKLLKIKGRSNIANRNLNTYFSDHYDSVIKDRSTYVHSSYITEDQIKTIERVLAKYHFNDSYISSEQIYERNKKNFNEVGIDNYRFLYGIVKSFKINGLQATGASMKLGFGEEQTIQRSIKTFATYYGNIIPIQTLKKRLNIKDIQINNLLNREVLYKLDSDTVVTFDYFQLKKQEKTLLKKYINNLLLEDDHAITTTLLYDKMQFDSEMARLLADYQIVFENQTNHRLLYFVSHVFPNDYEYNSNLKVISSKGLSFNKKTDFVAYHFKGKTFTREEIKNFYLKNDFRTNQIASFLKEYCFQYDEERFRLKEDAVVPNVIYEVIDFIDKEFKDEVFISASDILNRLHIREQDILNIYEKNPILIISHISEIRESPYMRPTKDYGQPNENLENLLINTKITKSNLMSKGIKMYIKHKFNKSYITVADLNEELLVKEIIPRPLKENAIEDVFQELPHKLIIKVGEK